MGEEYLHTVYRNAHRETTDWEAAQRRIGNLPPLEPEAKAPPWAPAGEAVLDAAALDGASAGALQEAEDATEDDRVLEAYRRKRLSQLQERPRRPRFGRVLSIGRDDFVREVTEASERLDVAVLLTRDALPACAAAAAALAALAAARPALKCVRIGAAEAVGGSYPDTQLPTLLLYRTGDVRLTLIGTSWAGPTLRHVTPEALAAALDRAPGGRAGGAEHSSDDEDGGSSDAHAAAQAQERAAAQEARQREEAAAAVRASDDEDSDFSD